MAEKLKYKVGDRILFEAIISEVDVDDTSALYYLSFDDDSGRWANEEELDALSDRLPPKPKVTQTVMDWCETKRAAGMIWKLAEWFDSEDMPVEVSDWLFTGADLLLKQHALATLIAHGPQAVEVEKEKKYVVILKVTGQSLYKPKDDNVGIYFSSTLSSRLTKQEIIGAGFEGVFDNPMFEVEEVE